MTPRDTLLTVLDEAHADALLADRERLGAPLSVDEAAIVARHCDEYETPNLAAEALIAMRYRGLRIRRPVVMNPTQKAGVEVRPCPGDIVREQEPAAFAKACELAGWGWKAEWKAARFPSAIAERARILTAPGRLRVVGGTDR